MKVETRTIGVASLATTAGVALAGVGGLVALGTLVCASSAAFGAARVETGLMAGALLAGAATALVSSAGADPSLATSLLGVAAKIGSGMSLIGGSGFAAKSGAMAWNKVADLTGHQETKTSPFWN